MKDIETKAKFVSLRGQSLSYDKISKQLKVSKPTLLKWETELHSQIKEAQRLEMQKLLDEYGLSQVSRLKRICKTLKKLEREEDKRDLSELKIEKIFEMQIQFIERLLDEISKANEKDELYDHRNNVSYFETLTDEEMRDLLFKSFRELGINSEIAEEVVKKLIGGTTQECSPKLN